MRTFLTIIAVAVGSLIGAGIAGGVGWFIGAILAYAGCLLVFEKKDTNRPIDGFWLRYRSHFLSAACILIGIVIGGAVIPGLGLLLGFAGGWFAGNWLGERLGWSGASQEMQVNMRFAYVSILVAAARSDGTITSKETREIIRVAQELFSSIGYGSSADVAEIYNSVKESSLSINETVELIGHFPDPIHISLQFDILRILFSAGETGVYGRQWLEAIMVSGVFKDWSVLQCFTRFSSVGNTRSTALHELGLDESATHEDIKRAYKAKAREYHPDRLQGVSPQIRALAEAKMAAINNAYQELIGTKSGRGHYFFKSEDGTQSIAVSSPASFTCGCWLCGQRNRIPSQAALKSARCGECHALLGLGFDPFYEK